MSAPDIVAAYGQVDENGRRYRDRLLKKNGRNSLRKDRPTMYFPLEAPDGTLVYPTHENGDEARWAMGTEGVKRNEEAGTLIWKLRRRQEKPVWEPYTREYAPDEPRRPYPSIWYGLPTMRQAKAELKNIFGTANSFDTPKPVELIERICELMNAPDSIILDSFAGSGTTAHAVLKLNQADGGNRKFILIETEDYAETITAERVKRVIVGYGEGAKAVPGTGGSFAFCELGEPLLQGEFLNENATTETIREYVYFTETRRPLDPTEAERAGEPYLLGICADVAYYFYYEKERVTELNAAFLKTLKRRVGSRLIYADVCRLSERELTRLNIRFKKIPRDISRL